MIELEAIEKILVEGGTDEAIRLLDEYITSAPELPTGPTIFWATRTERKGTGRRPSTTIWRQWR